MTLIAFDLDGTLTDTLESIVTALNKTLLHFNLPQHSLDEARKMIGFGAEILIQKAVQSDSKEFLDTVLEHYKKTLLVESQTVQLFKGMQELLDQLKAKGFKTAITSNKPKDTLLQFVNTQNIQVDVAIGVCEGTAPKPDKCMIDQLRKLYPGHKIILVGDTEIDYQTAVNAEIDSVIVSYGFRTVEELRGFGIAELVPSVEELSRVLLG
ncbi:Phosphoglycolate_phosphatase [Hexamita inflata]|uniref:Phosphoglycolate phosphatase n=1 Tax=Hexamita inflata TaxID=28002 RepID=A0AA86UX23_9EUKA|nr:Phosphoglycolate phosphatase [Hexamita inflata]